MPFQVKASSHVILNRDKVTSCDFDISAETEKVTDWCLSDGDLNDSDPGEHMTFNRVKLSFRIVFQLEKYGRLSQDKTYKFDYSSDSSIKDFLQDYKAIYGLSKAAKNASVVISKAVSPTIWLTNYRPNDITFYVGIGFIEKGDCNTPYLNVDGTGYYLEKEDLKALGEWLLSNIK